MNSREEILEKVNHLVSAYRQGLLGGEKCRKTRTRI